MLFSLSERFQILTLLPTEGNRVTGKIVSALANECMPSEKEIKDFQIKEGGQYFIDKVKGPVLVEQGTVKWDIEKEIPKEIEIGEILMDILVKKLKELESSNRLPLAMGTLYDRLVLKENT